MIKITKINEVFKLGIFILISASKMILRFSLLLFFIFISSLHFASNPQGWIGEIEHC